MNINKLSKTHHSPYHTIIDKDIKILLNNIYQFIFNSLVLINHDTIPL
jgi:hypothetical protein